MNKLDENPRKRVRMQARGRRSMPVNKVNERRRTSVARTIPTQ